MAGDGVSAASYDFEALTREVVISRLKDAQDPSALAAKTARDIILPALKATLPSQPSKTTTVQVCRGIVSGLLCINKDVPACVLAILGMTAEIAHEGNLEPAELMTWAMEGIASIMPLAGHDIGSAVQAAIEDRFMGAGEIFSGLCGRFAQESR